MEQLPGLKVVGHVDLLRFEKRTQGEKKRTQEKILESIDIYKETTVATLKERLVNEGLDADIIDTEGSISEIAFADIYDEAEILHDKKLTQMKKKGFYRTYDPETQKRYGIFDEDVLLEKLEHETKERMKDGHISEDVLFILMNKISGNRYLTLKSALYDDYENGTDMLLIDTKTQSVICAFDATVEGFNSRMDHKIERAKEKIRNGRGMQAKYGISFKESEDGTFEVQRGLVSGIPPLVMNIKKEHLHELLEKSNFLEKGDSEIENVIISQLIQSLESQIQELVEYTGKGISYEATQEFIEYLKQELYSKK